MERTRGNNMNWRSHVKEKIHLFISILTIFIVLLIGISVIQQVQLQSVKKESELLEEQIFFICHFISPVSSSICFPYLRS
ncbi:hypothetical protein GLZ93_09300 [Campylobacter jejuni]|nr:hypothetical protein [Campylobacter jejuni]EDP7300954.1 hypothetical protein [Campylobacter jejuni]